MVRLVYSLAKRRVGSQLHRLIFPLCRSPSHPCSPSHPRSTHSSHTPQPRPTQQTRPRSTTTRRGSTLTSPPPTDQLPTTASACVPSSARVVDEAWMVNLRDETWLLGPRPREWWTGVYPEHGTCPGVGLDGKIRSLPVLNLRSVTRAQTQAYFDNTWTLHETLFAGFNGEEGFFRPPVHGLRHPQVFYYGHSPCVYVNKLRVAGLLDGPVDEYFETIFEVGVDEMLWDDMHKNDMVWPTILEVNQYRKKVYETISNLIQTHPGLDDNNGSDPVSVDMSNPLWGLFMGFEHERIHFETSSVLFRESPLHLMQTPLAWPDLHPSALRSEAAAEPVEGTDYPSNKMLAVQAESVSLGRPHEAPGSYGWDNEFGTRTIDVPNFNASKFMISNGEMFEFVKDGGYRTQRYWSADGWAWRKFRNAKNPYFWCQDGPAGSLRFCLRTVFEMVKMQWDWPVAVNLHEAHAYCAWQAEKTSKTKSETSTPDQPTFRVITEPEHHLIRTQHARPDYARNNYLADRVMWAGGDKFADGTLGTDAANANLAFGSESPVGSLPASSSGHHDAMGNLWEWTEDHFNPLDGFLQHQVYDDFSLPCFDGRHNIILGGSFMSTGIEASAFARFSFRPHFLQHSGFRLVTSDHPTPATLIDPSSLEIEGNPLSSSSASSDGPTVAEEFDTNIYEDQALVDQYLGLHFPASGSDGTLDPILAHKGAPSFALRFPQRVADLMMSLNPKLTTRRALDVGCAVGGSSFHLAADGRFDEVVGFDFSHAFVAAANGMKQGAGMTFAVATEGELSTTVTAQHEANVTAEARARTSFHQGNACEILESAERLGMFDGAVVANLLCRLPDPLKCLDGLQAVINPGGIVVIATPFSWLADYTHRDKWLGGFTDEEGAAVHSLETLVKEMKKRGFELVHEEEIPLVIREHQRKYQYIVSKATAWKKL